MHVTRGCGWARHPFLLVTLSALAACGGDGLEEPVAVGAVGRYDLQSVDGRGAPFATWQAAGELEGRDVLIVSRLTAVGLDLRRGGTLVGEYQVQETVFDLSTGQQLDERTASLPSAGGSWAVTQDLITLDWVVGCRELLVLSAGSGRLTGNGSPLAGHSVDCDLVSSVVYAKR